MKTVFKRKLYDRLLEWKNERQGKTAILVEGARRVGKSTLVEEFAKHEYEKYILIDFNKAQKETIALFDDLTDLDFIFTSLQNTYNVQLKERKSLIVFDEVQLCPRARAAIKFLVADGRYDYIETGSLVSIRKNVKDIVIPSEERHLKMYPMDFEEFLWALGEDALWQVIKTCFEKKQPLAQALHRKAMTLFREYLIIGGMPQAVSEYLSSKDFQTVDAVKRDILSLYRDDIIKHASGYERKVTGIFDEIPSQLSKHEKKFSLSALGKGIRSRDYESAFLWLEDSMIVNICYNSTEPNIGLKLNRDNSSMKIYMGDTGLLISHAFDENGIVTNEIYKKLLFGKLEVNEGMLFENIVAQMLTANGHKLYFYSNAARNDRTSRMEIDFLIAKSKITDRHNISPLEVKSGKNYTLSSINKFCNKFSEQLNIPFVLHTENLFKKDEVVCLPVYMTMFL